MLLHSNRLRLAERNFCRYVFENSYLFIEERKFSVNREIGRETEREIFFVEVLFINTVLKIPTKEQSFAAITERDNECRCLRVRCDDISGSIS